MAKKSFKSSRRGITLGKRVEMKNLTLKARIRTSGGQYYHQFNKSSFIIVSLLPTKANHLPLVIGVLSNQHRSLG